MTTVQINIINLRLLLLLFCIAWFIPLQYVSSFAKQNIEHPLWLLVYSTNNLIRCYLHNNLTSIHKASLNAYISPQPLSTLVICFPLKL